MKRFIPLLLLLLVIAATPLYAFSIPGWDAIKDFAGAGAWQATALVVTALLGLAGLAKYTKIVTAGAVFMQVLFAGIASIAESFAAVCGYVAVSLEDGKLSSDEIKQVPVLWKSVKASIKATWTTVGTAWKALKGND
jgi:hypothetical protein